MSCRARAAHPSRRTAPLAALLLALLASGAGASRAADTATPDRVTAAYREALARSEAGQLADALGPAKRAYDYAQQDLGIDDERLAMTALGLGTLLLELDRPVDALRPLTHARELYDHQRGPSSSKARQAQHRVADANERLGRFETAERTYLDLIERAKQADGDPTMELAGIYARLQMLTAEAGAAPRSRRYGLQAMKLYRKARGPESLPEGLVAVRIARAALEANDWEEGLELLEHGVPIVEKRLEPGDPQLSKLYEFLIEMYTQIGDTHRERRYRIRLKKNRKQEPEFERRRAEGPGAADDAG